jgi:hypothetical protein
VTKEGRRIEARVERCCFIHKKQGLSSALPKNYSGYKGMCSKNKGCHRRPGDDASDRKRVDGKNISTAAGCTESPTANSNSPPHRTGP